MTRLRIKFGTSTGLVNSCAVFTDRSNIKKIKNLQIYKAILYFYYLVYKTILISISQLNSHQSMTPFNLLFLFSKSSPRKVQKPSLVLLCAVFLVLQCCCRCAAGLLHAAVRRCCWTAAAVLDTWTAAVLCKKIIYLLNDIIIIL